MIITYKFRLKDKQFDLLYKMSADVNFVWNYANDVSIQYLDKFGRQCKRLRKNSLSIESDPKRRKLSWRSKKRSLGWVPFNGQSIDVHGNSIRYKKTVFRFWKSREIDGKIKSGSFSQDTRGKWYVSFSCEVDKPKHIKSGADGQSLSRENITNKYAAKTRDRATCKKEKTGEGHPCQNQKHAKGLAARNILRFGRETPIKGNPFVMNGGRQ